MRIRKYPQVRKMEEKRKETDDAEPSQRSPRTVHTFAVWATTRFVPTGELRHEFSFRVGACGRRPLESADPGLGVAVDVGEP